MGSFKDWADLGPATRGWLRDAVAAAAILVALVWVSQVNYLLFHGLAEGFSIAVAVAAFSVMWNARRYLTNNYLLLVGIAYAFVAGLDLLHTLAYAGMGIFPHPGSNLATQLWISARYMQAITLLVAIVSLNRSLREWVTVAVYGLVTALLLAAIFWWEVFPDCYIGGSGLTPFKLVSEYVIAAMLLAATGLLWRHRHAFTRQVLGWMTISLLATVASEIAFTFYHNVYGIPNLVGHLLKLIAFYAAYKALVEACLRRPFALLLQSRTQLSERVAERTAQLEATNARLQERETLFRELAENVREVFWVSDPVKRVFVYVSPMYEQVWGRSREALYTDSMAYVNGVHPSDRERVIAAYRGASGAVDETFRVIHPERGIRWVRARSYPVRDAQGRVVRIVGTTEDITRSREIQEALRESERHYRVLFEEMINGFAVTQLLYDRDRKPYDIRFLSVNPAFERMTELPAEAVVGRTAHEALGGLEPDWLRRFAEVVETGKPTHFESYSPLFERHLMIQAFRPEEGQVAVQFYDVTERAEMEAQIRDALHERETLLRELYHRTKNNMSVISALLEMQATAQDDEVLQEILGEMQGRIRAMALVHEMLYQSQDLSRIDLKDYIEELVRLLVQSQTSANGHVQVTVEADSVPVVIDVAVPCGLILSELVSNAYKHAFADGSPHELRIALKRLVESGVLLLRVSDDGEGLPSGFDARAATTLGLQTVYALGEHQLQGEVSFSSDDGLTAEVRFRADLYRQRV
ncbi:MAG: MASE3 domain-containing protein [Anaerolineae bacterium]